MALTITHLLLEARGILNDVTPTVGGTTRYSDQDLLDAFNDALLQARAKRPDLFLLMGLRNTVPQYGTADVSGSTAFPLPSILYPAFISYICGRSEMREDTFTDDKRAEALLAKFVGQLVAVNS